MSEFIYKGKDFYLNGEKFTIRSGAMHYFRTPRAYWKDRLLKLKECGFNTVETYVAWNLHEPKEGTFDFSSDNDIGAFFDLAKELGLYVMLRPGPYICAEWDAGGFPAWLLAPNGVRVRCNDEWYFEKVTNWTKKWLEIVLPRLITKGGNILMLAVENEYASHGNDKSYLRRLRDLYRELGVDCLLFTADGPDDGLIENGAIEDCLPTMNFGDETEKRMSDLADAIGDRPLVCAEFWCGWFDHWYEKHHVRSAESICNAFEPFLKNGYNFNFYMFHGGTNFGFMNGANDHVSYQPTVTSYDYNALLTESGDRTPQYYGVRDLMIKYGVDVPPLTATESEKRGYGKIEFTAFAPFFENVENIGEEKNDPTPIPMERLSVPYGYVLYSTLVPKAMITDELILEGLGDRAIVFADGEKVGVLERGRSEGNTLEFHVREKDVKLDILVENMGRCNYGPVLTDKKGLSGVKSHWSYFTRNLFGWKSVSLDVTASQKLEFKPLPPTVYENPAFFKGVFTVDRIADTFIKPTGFSKGFILINGKNIGRYYNAAGPQKTLYVPACWLKEGENKIVIFDSDGASEIFAEFVDKPELG